MTTIVERFDGVALIRPLNGFMWPHHKFSGFPECCGAGEGMGEKVVPEKILDMSVSPACYVHDWMFLYGDRDWQGFHHANSIFLNNLLSINEKRGGNWFLRKLRIPLITGWFISVSSVAGAAKFFSLGAK